MDEMGQKYQAFDIKMEVGLCFWQQRKIQCDWSLQAIGIVLWGKLRRYKQYKIFCTSTAILKRMYFYISMTLLGIFMCIFQSQKAHCRLNMSVSLSVHMYHLGSHETNFWEIWYWKLLLKSMKKIQNLLMCILHCWQYYNVAIKLVSSS